MTLINITIAKTPTAGHIRCWNAKITKQDSMKANIFTCVITSGTTIALGDEINFYNEDNVYTFGGYVQKPVENTGYISLECADYGIQLSQNTANESLENYTPEEIIEYLIDNYTDLTFVNNLTITNSSISKTIIIDEYLIDKITNMLSLFKGAFNVDKNKNFYLYQVSDVLNTNTIINGVDALYGGWKTDNNKRAERVIVKGDTIQQRTTETITGTGTEFETTYTPDNVEISGLTQTTENIEGDYTVDEINNKIIFNTSKTDPTISYTYDSVIRVELGTGKTVTLEKTYIKSKSEAIKLAKEYKSKFQDGAQSSKWIKSSNSISDYNIGESIMVTDEINNRTGTYNIKTITLEYPQKLTIEVGETEDDLFDWQKEAIERIKQLEEKNNSSEFITKYDYLQNKVKVNITVEITKLESYVDDGTLLWASDTTLSSDADLISDDDPETLWLKLDGDVIDSVGDYSPSVEIATSGSEDYETGLQFDEAFNFIGGYDSSSGKYIYGAYIDLNQNIDVNSVNHSVSFWYKTSSSYLQSIAINSLGSTSGRINLKPSENSLLLESQTNNDWNRTLSTGIDIDDGEWHNYIIVFSDTDTKLYVDNVLRDTEDANTDTLGYFRYRIIGGYGNTTYTYGESPTGQMADFRIFDEYQLDYSETTEIYNSSSGLTTLLNDKMFALAYDDSAVPSSLYINYL